MNILSARRADEPLHRLYATKADFCRIFARDMNRLYLLSLLLTADPELAEKCFVHGLEESKGGNRVFREWAHSWARRTIITNAIRMIRPRPDGTAPDYGSRDLTGLPTEFAAVMQLKAFDRFVFVMSVLVGYAQRDCMLLLDCSSSDIFQARILALQTLGDFAQLRAKFANISDLRAQSDDSESALPPAMIPRLAVSA